MILIGDAIDGNLVLSPRDQTELSKFLGKHNRKKIEMKIGLRRSSISDKQRAYFYGVIIDMILEEQGSNRSAVNDDQCATDLYQKFLKTPSVIDPTKVSHKTLSMLSTVEAEEFFANIREWASHFFPLFIPLPNEYDLGMVYSEPPKARPMVGPSRPDPRPDPPVAGPGWGGLTPPQPHRRLDGSGPDPDEPRDAIEGPKPNSGSGILPV